MIKVEKIPNDLEAMESSIARLNVLIDDVYSYVNAVVVSFFYFTYSRFS